MAVSLSKQARGKASGSTPAIWAGPLVPLRPTLAGVGSLIRAVVGNDPALAFLGLTTWGLPYRSQAPCYSSLSLFGLLTAKVAIIRILGAVISPFI